MILPTDEPESVNAAMIAGWLAALNGPSVDASGMLSAQRELLLTLICRYHAFMELPPGVKENDFYQLAHKIIDAVFELAMLQHADAKLQEIIDWLQALLPAVRPHFTSCFDAFDMSKSDLDAI